MLRSYSANKTLLFRRIVVSSIQQYIGADDTEIILDRQ